MTDVRNYLPAAIAMVFLFGLVHLFKLARLYLVLIDEKIRLRRFFFAYFLTTLLNSVIPFKLGEFYRIYVFNRLTGSVEIGFLSVVIDRFFDTLGLVLILIPLQILYPDTVSAVSIFLTAFLVVIVFIYCIFLSTYRYLNRYIILNRTSPRSMAVLRALSGLKVWYDYVKRLVSGRYGLLLLLSLLAWTAEGLLLRVFYGARFGKGFQMRVFCEYIASILDSSRQSLIGTAYTERCAVLLLFATILSGIFYLVGFLKQKFGSLGSEERDKVWVSEKKRG